MVRDPATSMRRKYGDHRTVPLPLFCLAAAWQHCRCHLAWLLSATHCCLSVPRLLFNCLSAHFLSPLDSLGCIFAAPSAHHLPAIPQSPTTGCTTSCTQRTTGTLSCLTRFEMKRCSSTVKPSRRRFNLGTPIAPFRTTLPYFVKENIRFTDRVAGHAQRFYTRHVSDWCHRWPMFHRRFGVRKITQQHAAQETNDREKSRMFFSRPRRNGHGVNERPATCFNLDSITQFEGAQLGLCRSKVYTRA